MSESASRMQVLALCVSRGGYRHGRRVAQFIVEWEMAVRATGGPITAEEFAAWWHDGNATAYRRLAEFRELFPQLGERGFPHDLMRPLLEQLRDVDVDVDVPLMVPVT